MLAKRLFIAGDEAAAIGHNELVAFKAQHSSDAMLGFYTVVVVVHRV